MSRSQRDRLTDILAACDRVMEYASLDDVDADLRFDAIRIRLVEIGEAAKDLDANTRAASAGVPWDEISRMRDLLTHRYFDTIHAIVMTTARDDIPPLAEEVRRLLQE